MSGAVIDSRKENEIQSLLGPVSFNPLMSGAVIDRAPYSENHLRSFCNIRKISNMNCHFEKKIYFIGVYEP